MDVEGLRPTVSAASGARRRGARPSGGSDMMRRWTAIIMALAFAAAGNLATGPGEAQAKPAGETGGRHPGSRIASGAGGNHTCVVKEDGTVQCWGSNASGQLGNGASGAGQFETT